MLKFLKIDRNETLIILFKDYQFKKKIEKSNNNKKNNPLATRELFNHISIFQCYMFISNETISNFVSL